MTNSVIVSKFQYLGFDVEISKLLVGAEEKFQYKLSQNSVYFFTEIYTLVSINEAEKNAKICIKDLVNCETANDITEFITCYLIDWHNMDLLRSATTFAINYVFNKLKN
jgi:hypothetical protein